LNRPVATRFDRETAVEHLGGTRYGAEASERWPAYVGPNGGYLAAIILSAFTDTLDDPRRAPRSISVHYLEPPSFGSLEVHVRVRRSGRSMTTLSGELVQDGRTKVLALAGFSNSRRGPTFHDAVMPVVPPPPAEGDFVTSNAVELAQVFGPSARSGEAADIGAWVRLDEPRVLDALLAAVYVDSWYPALVVRVPGQVSAPTVDLTVHFRRVLPPPDTSPTTHYFLRLRSLVAGDGFVEEDAELWSPSGELLVQSRQLQVIFDR
jgi:acyl-CoA thioesterase